MNMRFLAVLLLCATPAMAADCDNPWQHFADKIAAAKVPLDTVPPALVANIEANFNAAPPASQEHIDHAYVAHMTRFDALFLVGDGCVVSAFPVDGDTLRILEAPPGEQM